MVGTISCWPRLLVWFVPLTWNPWPAIRWCCWKPTIRPNVMLLRVNWLKIRINGRWSKSFASLVVAPLIRKKTCTTRQTLMEIGFTCWLSYRHHSHRRNYTSWMWSMTMLGWPLWRKSNKSKPCTIWRNETLKIWDCTIWVPAGHCTYLFLFYAVLDCFRETMFLTHFVLPSIIQTAIPASATGLDQGLASTLFVGKRKSSTTSRRVRTAIRTASIWTGRGIRWSRRVRWSTTSCRTPSTLRTARPVDGSQWR